MCIVNHTHIQTLALVWWGRGEYEEPCFSNGAREKMKWMPQQQVLVRRGLQTNRLLTKCSQTCQQFQSTALLTLTPDRAPGGVLNITIKTEVMSRVLFPERTTSSNHPSSNGTSDQVKNNNHDDEATHLKQQP